MYKDITELAEEGSYDKAIIVSGDGDFVEAVRKLKEIGKKYEIWSFKKSLSRNLATEAGEENINYIENILDSVEFKKKKNTKKKLIIGISTTKSQNPEAIYLYCYKILYEF